MLNLDGKTFIIVLLAPMLCVGVLAMFVFALCDFSASRLKGRFAVAQHRRVMKGSFTTMA
jgi:hypothetical protein